METQKTNLNVKINTILNKIREDNSINYQNAVPILDEKTVLNSTYGACILGQPAIKNEFLNTFMNQFMYNVTAQHIFESEFDRLKEPANPMRVFGEFESFTNTIKPIAYDMNALDRVLKMYKADVKTAYFTRTREDIFPMSVAREELEGAFISYDSFNAFINSLYSVLRTSNKVVEYNAIKECINVNVNGGAVKVVKIPKITKSNASDVATMIKSYVGKMTKPSTLYNNYINIEGATGDAVETSTPEENLLLIADSDTESIVGVNVLASAFNLSFAEFKGNKISVDDFGYNVYDRETQKIVEHKTSKIKFMLCDEALFKIKDSLDLEMTGTNDATLVRQNFYHVWQSINMRPWANAIVFVEDTTEIESAEFEDNSMITLDYKGVEETEKTISIKPADTEIKDISIEFVSFLSKVNDTIIDTETLNKYVKAKIDETDNKKLIFKVDSTITPALTEDENAILGNVVIDGYKIECGFTF